MKTERMVRGELCANGYIVYDEKSLEAYIIDPGYDGPSYLEKIRELKLIPKGIILTHHHYDHVDAALELKKALKLPILIHEADGPRLKFKANVLLKDGDLITFGDTELMLINTPGHTKGSSCFLNIKDKLAFTGDTIFNVDLGRTDLADGSSRQMVDSITRVISLWEDDLVIYPGHGDPASMEYVRKHNSEYLEIMAETDEL